MNTEEILACMKQDSRVAPYFEGVYARNQLPNLSKFPTALIANTDVSTGPGKHWVGMYFGTEGRPMYFDSYGLPPQQPEFVKYLGSTYEQNDIQLQSPFSSTCGQYTVYFVAMACRGCSMREIREPFTGRDCGGNDALVTRFVNNNYDVKTAMYDFDYLIKQICVAMNE